MDGSSPAVTLSRTREIGCQTEPLDTRDFGVQARVVPRRMNKACQMRPQGKKCCLRHKTCPHCDHSSKWKSQPHIANFPAGNLQLSAATSFTGCSFLQVKKFLAAFNIQSISDRTYFNHQSQLLHPTILWQWKCDQTVLLQQAAQDGDVFLRGDMRADTPGHCAKYTMMDLKANRVIDLQLVQIQNVLREEKPAIQHFYDVWHVAKDCS
ncbi:hypothetical protein SKAU_G00352480 [Synaphobranchus kaupii]|uniref:Uncharacterized protein n=1 Tax=Synaphobranchus kaupii TaxID=118154 RepID=A0A9Q1EKY7_SYNKA|nr:hypothetical protein SKAU_G00352480 [Synaphobranchus kaupii]